MSSAQTISTRRRNIGTLYFVALLREELGARIKEARVAAGMTQRELADRIHLKNATDVSRYERGTVDVPSHRIDLIASATDRPRSFFTRDPSEPEAVDESRVAKLEGELRETQRALKALPDVQASLDRIEDLLRGREDAARSS